MSCFFITVYESRAYGNPSIIVINGGIINNSGSSEIAVSTFYGNTSKSQAIRTDERVEGFSTSSINGGVINISKTVIKLLSKK